MSQLLRAGFSKIDITPPLDRIEAYGLGYWFHRSVRFTGVRDPLFVRTVVIAGEFRYVVVSVDSILDSYGFLPDACSRIANALGIEADNVFITCTHTHSSPLIDRNDTRAGWEYGQWVRDRIVRSAIEADRDCAPATLSVSSGPIRDVLYNRRPLLRDGRIPELHRPVSQDLLSDPGPVNDTMTIVKFHRGDGAVAGGLCHFGIHGVAVQCSELISSDCMGRAIQLAEREAGNQTVLLHLNGACGDIDPVSMGGDEALDTMTARLHRGVRAVLNAAARPLPISPIRTSRHVFRAARRPARPVVVLERERRELLGTIEASGLRHHSGVGYEAFLLAEEAKVSVTPAKFEIPYQFLRLGTVILAGIGGEVFTHCGLALQATLPEFSVLPVGLTGGAAGYLPTREMYAQGGYEVACASWSLIAPGETEKLLAGIHSDLRKVAESEAL